MQSKPPRRFCQALTSTRTCLPAINRRARRCQQRKRSASLSCARGIEDWDGWACAADVLIIDATNVACIAAADSRALRGVGATLHAQFDMWLDFLRLAVDAPHAIAVFDDDRVRLPTDCLQACVTVRLRRCSEQSSMASNSGAAPSKQFSSNVRSVRQR